MGGVQEVMANVRNACVGSPDISRVHCRVAYPDPKDQNHFGGSGSEIFPPIRDRRKERLKFEFKFLRESNIAVVKNLYPDPERETRILFEIKSLIRIRIKTS